MFRLNVIIHRRAVYLTNGAIFENKLLDTKRVFRFSLQLRSESFLIVRRTEREMFKNVHCVLCKVPLLLSDFNEIRIFWTDFREILRYQIS